MKNIALSLFFAATLFGQTASITGRVTDSSGAVIPSVSITVESIETNSKTSVVTNDDGYYTAALLPPGSYNLLASKPGFKPLRQTALTLRVQQVARIDLVLEVGMLTESVEVSARAVLLDSETSTLGEVVQSRQVAELPLLGRNPYALAMLVTGVRPAAGVNDVPVNQINQSSTSINGQRGNANEFLLDGAPNSAPSQNQPVIFPSVDAVQEFKIETNGFSAEYGRAAGGIFNVVTKSGTNEAHFTAYDFLRNDAVNANNWFANRSGTSPAPFKMNQFGGVFGSPVVIPKVYNGRNRTFFFGSIELVRLVQGVTYSNTVPRPEQLAGDFSRTLNSAGALVQIYDPVSTRAGATAGSFARDVFPGNRIPMTRMDPVAVNMAKYWPAPTSVGNPITGVNNYVHTGGDHTTKDTFSLRFDHHVNDRNRIFTRTSYDDAPIVRSAPYGPGNPASPQSGPQDFGRRNSVIEDSHILNPSTLAIFRFSFTRLSNFRTVFSNGFDIKSLGLPASLDNELRQVGAPLAFPIVTVPGESVLGNTSLIRLGNDIYAGQAQLVKSLSKHTLKTGGEYRVIKFNNNQTDGVGPSFTFNNSWTQGPDPTRTTATAGYGLATFLLGVAGGTVNPLPAVAQQSTYYGFFLQDDFKVSPKLTLNLGVRYEYESPRTDRFNQLTNFDSSIKPPLNGAGLDLHGALTFAGANGVSRFQSDPDRNNFSPRLGFAYKLAPKMVIRGGGGIFYAANTGIGTGAGAFGISGFDAASSVVTSLDGVTPITFLRNPFPSGLVHPSGSKLGAATQLGQAVSFSDRGNRTPYAEQWNFNLQRELPGGILLDVGYAGSHGLKFQQGRSLNQLPDSTLAQGPALRTLVANPFYGQIPTGILAQPTVSRAQLLRPFPQFDGVTSQNADWASSIYHALQAKIEKRYSRGFTILASYTYSKMIDYGTGTWNGETLGGAAIQDWNNLRADRSVAELDQTHRLIVNGVYELQVGKSLHGLAKTLVRGWQVGGILSLFSGEPLGLNSAVNNTFSQGGGQRPNWSGVSPQLDNPTPDHWFDTSQFSSPPPYTFGNAGRTASGNRADTTKQLDLTLSKRTQITERLDLQFRAEFFNFTNTPHFDPPNVSFGNQLFGVVSSQRNQARIVQFALKLNY